VTLERVVNGKETLGMRKTKQVVSVLGGDVFKPMK
jgi:hypothetical protein